jgi:hypothetical protein
MRLSLLMSLMLAGAAAPLSAQSAAVICKDGTASAVSGRGACTGHGGVDKDASKAEKKVVKAEQKEVKAEEKTAVKTAKHTGTMVMCTDGTESEPGRGACGHHGGIRVAGAAVASSRAEDRDPAGAIAQCKDGLYSHASTRRGACSRHNGVAKWM